MMVNVDDWGMADYVGWVTNEVMMCYVDHSR